MTDAEKIAAIKRLAMKHNSPAVNVGAHRLAGLILGIVDSETPSESVLEKGS